MVYAMVLLFMLDNILSNSHIMGYTYELVVDLMIHVKH
jgi:hypothetical protein